MVANGFSCKTQIADAGTGRRALHAGQVMALARARAVGRKPATTPGAATATADDRRPSPGRARRAIRVVTLLLPVLAGGGLAAVRARRAGRR